MLEKLAPYRKALAGFAAPGVVLFVADVTADQALPTHNEWVAIGLACIAGFAGVYVAPKNKPRT